MIKTNKLGLNKPQTTDQIGDTIGTHLPENYDILDAEVGGGKAKGALNVLAKRPSLQGITAEVDSLVKATVQGRTLVNLLGKDGNCEDVSKWNSPWQLSVVVDNGRFKATIGTGYTIGAHSVNKPASVDNSKYYVVVATLANGNATRVYLVDSTGSYGTWIESTSNTKTWKKFNPTEISSITDFGYRLEGTEGQYAYVDGFMLLEITEAEYNDPNYEPPDYFESVQHLRYPTFKSHGKNLVPSFDKWNLHANAKLLGSYKLELNSTGTSDASFAPVILKPNTYYVLSSAQGQFAITDGVNVLLPYGTGNRTFNSGNYTSVYIYASNDNLGTGTFTFENPQLEEGSVATAFEPNQDEIMVIPEVLGEGEKYEDGKVIKLWEKDVILDGSLAWAFSNDGAGFKRVALSNMPFAKTSGTEQFCIKYDGKLLKQWQAIETSDSLWFYSTNDGLFITIPDTDSGWGETYTPTADEIKAYFYGWRMHNADGTTPYVSGTKYWRRILYDDLATTTLPTASYDGFTPYKLHYKLAKPQIYEVQPIGAISLAEGQNNVEVTSGYVLGEVVNPKNGGDGNYHIGLDNPSNIAHSPLKYKNKGNIVVYKNGELDPVWVNQVTATDVTGWCYTPIANFDPTATYTVDYIILPEEHNHQVQTVDLSWATGLRDAYNLLVKQITKLAKQQ